MFVLPVLTIAILGGVCSYPDGTPYNYLPPNTPYRNGVQNYAQNQYQQSQPQMQYNGQAQHTINHYQSHGGFNNQPEHGGFHTAGYADQAGFGPQSSDVYKSLYYFDSPEDIELPPPRISYASDARRNSRHYKIIFIKAPGYVQKPITDIQANIGAVGGGKTIIYVLTKKPEAQQDVVINTGATQQAVNKPEVYYIKYDSKQDAEHQISQSLNGQHGGAIQARPVDSDREFLGNIIDTIDVRSQGPIVKNFGNVNGGHQAPQGAQILGFNKPHPGGFSTPSPLGYSSSNTAQGHYTGYSTLAPSGYGSGPTTGGHIGYSTVAPQTTYGGNY